MYFDRKRNYAKLSLLTARMKSMGYSVRQVAQMLNVPYTTFWNKIHNVSSQFCDEIVKMLGIPDIVIIPPTAQQFKIFPAFSPKLLLYG